MKNKPRQNRVDTNNFLHQDYYYFQGLIITTGKERVNHFLIQPV